MLNRSRDLPSIQIGPKLRAELWRELMTIAKRMEQTHDIHERRKLQSSYDALLELFLFGDAEPLQ